MIRVLILSAGDGERWSNFEGVPKHLVDVEGEILLERTCKQFLKYTDDVTVVGPADDRYKIDGTTLYTPTINKPKWGEMGKFRSSHELWSPGRTVLAFGDVYYTDEAVKTIMTNTDEWRCFLRKGPSSFTGCQYREIFAFAFEGSQHQRIRDKIADLIQHRSHNQAGGWALFSKMVFDTHNYLFDNPFYTEIDDWTEDFDFAKDLLIWRKNRDQEKNKKESPQKLQRSRKTQYDDPQEGIKPSDKKTDTTT